MAGQAPIKRKQEENGIVGFQYGSQLTIGDCIWLVRVVEKQRGETWPIRNPGSAGILVAIARYRRELSIAVTIARVSAIGRRSPASADTENVLGKKQARQGSVR